MDGLVVGGWWWVSTGWMCSFVDGWWVGVLVDGWWGC